MSIKPNRPGQATFRPYTQADEVACLRNFDANCPEFFAPEERQDYQEFLRTSPAGYEVCEVAGEVVGAFGLIQCEGNWRLNWILLAPETQGQGVGRGMMQRIMQRARQAEAGIVLIAASHLSAPFFAGFGAVELSRTEHGWGPDMHRVDMELSVR